MKRTLLVLLVALVTLVGGCRASSHAQVATPSTLNARTDTIDILEAVWHAATSGHTRLRVPWLYLPQTDTGMVPMSSEVRAALGRRGIPASAREPTGDDTVVFRVRRWQSATSAASLVQVSSKWTTVLASGTRRCRTGSGNSESYQAVRTASGWAATLSGPVMHGDKVCVPIP
jgi:hypothetical protein